MFANPEKVSWEFGFMPGQKVADFGSGSGHYALALSRAVGSGGKVYAVDLRKEALDVLNKRALEENRRNIQVVIGDVEEPGGTGIDAESLDGVVLSNLLSQVEDKTGVVREAKRVLKVRGSICVVDWTSRLSPEDARKLFENNECALTRKFPAGDKHYGIIFKS